MRRRISPVAAAESVTRWHIDITRVTTTYLTPVVVGGVRKYVGGQCRRWAANRSGPRWRLGDIENGRDGNGTSNICLP